MVAGHGADSKYLGLKRKEVGETVAKVTVVVYGKQNKDGKLIDGTVYVPMRAIGEARGDKVSWDNKKKTATITEL